MDVSRNNNHAGSKIKLVPCMCSLLELIKILTQQYYTRYATTPGGYSHIDICVEFRLYESLLCMEVTEAKIILQCHYGYETNNPVGRWRRKYQDSLSLPVN